METLRGLKKRSRKSDISTFFSFQMEIAKRLNAIIAQLLPFLSQEVRQVNIYFSIISNLVFNVFIIFCSIIYSTNNKLSLLWKEQNKSRCQSLIPLLGWVLLVLLLLYFRILIFCANFNPYWNVSIIGRLQHFPCRLYV